ncbi:MAG: glycosyltransferase family 2 protein [Candidatus Spechtbacterales bacterium]
MNNDTIHDPDVHIILLNWNNSEETLTCLRSLTKVSYNNFQVVVVDNGSTDNSIEKLESFRSSNPVYPIIILKNEENKGFAGGNNTGFEYSLKEGVEYVLILNNDTTTDAMFLSELVETAEKNKDVGVVGAAVYFTEPRNLLWFGGDTKIEWRKMADSMSCELFRKELPEFMPPLEVSFITGACMLFKREVLEKVKGFDERFFLYFEDADLSFRISKAGYKLMWNPKARIWHKVSATTLTQVGSPKLHYYHTRNVLLLGDKHAPSWMKIYKPLWSIFQLSKQSLKVALGIHRDVSMGIIRGILDYYRKRFGQYEKIHNK